MPTPSLRRQRWPGRRGAAVVATGAAPVPAYYSRRHDPPTPRARRSIAAGGAGRRPGRGRAGRRGRSDVVLELVPPAAGCRLPAHRRARRRDAGAQLTIRTARRRAGTARPDRRAATAARTRPAPARRGDDRLRADAGEFVPSPAELVSPAVVTLTATTGCRPRSTGFAAECRAAGTGRPVGAVAARVLTAWARRPCNGSGTAVAVPGRRRGRAATGGGRGRRRPPRAAQGRRHRCGRRHGQADGVRLPRRPRRSVVSTTTRRRHRLTGAAATASVDEGLGAVGEALLDEDGGAGDADARQHVVRRDVRGGRRTGCTAVTRAAGQDGGEQVGQRGRVRQLELGGPAGQREPGSTRRSARARRRRRRRRRSRRR